MTMREYKIAKMYIAQIEEYVNLSWSETNNKNINLALYKIKALKSWLYKNTVPFSEPYTVNKKRFK